MGESSMGAVVPAADKAELKGDDALTLAMAEKELLCPICMQVIKDAFLTACGHSFCYMCITTHLQNKSDCPCCAEFLTPSQLP
ncbi:UNVERIFIED_CONTAM: E3 ubiquitin-protein ligase COP1 [Sesamum radiatum]|uniref:E3 ubiquitin-protein ligase COP1 n=1 Tax=Sesamum radiatum TaxID=300843 RepID=A0AAW2K488_SESRA